MNETVGELQDTTLQQPLAYFITFSCYGARLHGDEDGSVDLEHNQFGKPFLPPNQGQREASEAQMDQGAYTMDSPKRTIVLRTIIEVCEYREWTLMAAHVRTNHVHVVVRGNDRPEKMMNDFKAYSSRKLNECGFDQPDRKRWARHGSTRYLWNDAQVAAKVEYTLYGQGEIMAAYAAPIATPSEPRP